MGKTLYNDTFEEGTGKLIDRKIVVLSDAEVAALDKTSMDTVKEIGDLKAEVAALKVKVGL